MSKKVISVLILISFIFVHFTLKNPCFAIDKTNHILILNSYNPTLHYTHSIMQGIYSTVESDHNIIHVENIDTQINNNEDYLKKLSELYCYKFKDYKFDVIIATNDTTYDFLNQYHDTIFKDVPVVFCNIHTHTKEEILNNHSFFVMEHFIDFTKLMDMALKLHPTHRTVFIPINPKFANPYYENLLEKEKKRFKEKNVKIISYHSNNVNAILSKVHHLPKNSILIFPTPFQGKYNELMSMANICKLFSNFKTMPIYSVFDCQLKPGFSKEIDSIQQDIPQKKPPFHALSNRAISKHLFFVSKKHMFNYNKLKQSGATGGILLNGYDQGKSAGKLALSILDGKNMTSHSFFISNRYLFNHDKLKQFHVDFRILPKDSILLKDPSNFYTISKEFLYIIGLFIILLLTLVILFLLTNISKRKKLEGRLEKTKDRYLKLIDILPLGVIVHNEGKIVFMNHIMLKLLEGQHYTDFIGRSIFDFIHPHDEYVLYKRIQSQQDGNFLSPMEYTIIKDNGGYVSIQARSCPFSFEGLNSLVLVEDITEKKQTEALQEKIKKEEEKLKQALEYDQLKTEFFSNLSHELKTPLNLIFATTQLLETNAKKYCCDKSIYKHITILKQNSYRMLRLVNNLIDITKMDCGYFEINLQNHNIISIVEDITLSVAEYVKSKNISLLFDTDIEEKIIPVDPNSIERIMLNLLSNAIKFTNSGDSILVNIYDKKDHILLSVKDTGIGIPKDKLDIIFDRFRQVDKSLTRNHEGSGIGLSLVKSLVDMHHGEITVRSEYGKGTEFIINLPGKVLDFPPIYDEENYVHKNRYIEKISIEFSDIYSLNKP